MRRAALVAAGLIVSTAVTAIVASASGEASSPPPRAQTLVAAPRGILAFAQDGNVIAWSSLNGHLCPEVRIRDLRSGREARVPSSSGDECEVEYEVLAVTGSRFVLGWMGSCCNHGYGGVSTGAIGSREHGLAELDEWYHAYGDFVVGAGGDAAELVYAITHVDEANPSDRWCADDWMNCTFRVTGGGVFRVEGQKAVKIPHVRPAAMIALAAHRLAVVRADLAATGSSGVFVRPAVDAPVEIFGTRSGRRLSSFKPQGRIRALALSQRVAAVLLETGGQQRLQTYDVRSGARRAGLRVEQSVRAELAASGTRVAYVNDRTIRTFDALTGTTATVATASFRPTQLAFDGTRLSWVENRRAPRPFESHPGPGWIRSVVAG